ncbi:MAG: NAD(P)-dependent oxidoreductase [Planctomycetota bacterium]|nr:MAG: NAD(P)-dependent oxidoreductase [Planctomycetota bacterium]
MPEYTQLLSSPRLEEKFSPKPSLNPKQAWIEASRCLYCYDAPCIQACATGINIPEFIRKIASHNLKGAAKTILRSNILGYSCAKVCPVEVMCEGACVYNHSQEPPVAIAMLQEYATKAALENNWRFFYPAPPKHKKVAVIGSGPAGLACAHELARRGYETVVFEGRTLPGGLNTTGVAPYKLSVEQSLREVEYVQKIGFEIRTGVWVGKDVSYEELDREFHAIFLAVGLGLDRKLGIPGENAQGCVGALQTIEEIRTKSGFQLNSHRRCVVVGGGNTSLDIARELKKLGVEQVALIYRRRTQDMPGYRHELEAALKEGVVFYPNTQPLEILSQNGKVRAIRCVQTKLENGQIHPLEGTEFEIPADHVYIAIGQPPLVEFLRTIPQLRLRENHTVEVNEYFQSSNPKVFAGGDCINGGKEVVNAVQHGRDAAGFIDAYLEGKL